MYWRLMFGELIYFSLDAYWNASHQYTALAVHHNDIWRQSHKKSSRGAIRLASYFHPSFIENIWNYLPRTWGVFPAVLVCKVKLLEHCLATLSDNSTAEPLHKWRQAIGVSQWTFVLLLYTSSFKALLLRLMFIPVWIKTWKVVGVTSYVPFKLVPFNWACHFVILKL